MSKEYDVYGENFNPNRDLPIGTYIRTIYGISKIAEGVYYLSTVSKASADLVDLIEIDDYVNGSKVISIEEHNNEKYIYVQDTEYCNACDVEEHIYYKEDTIKDVLTKEEYNRWKFRNNLKEKNNE